MTKPEGLRRTDETTVTAVPEKLEPREFFTWFDEFFKGVIGGNLSNGAYELGTETLTYTRDDDFETQYDYESPIEVGRKEYGTTQVAYDEIYDEDYPEGVKTLFRTDRTYTELWLKMEIYEEHQAAIDAQVNLLPKIQVEVSHSQNKFDSKLPYTEPGSPTLESFQIIRIYNN